MNINEAYSSQYLTARDITKPTKVIIKHADLEQVGHGNDAQDKIVLGFRGGKKGMVLNKTNALTIAQLHGDETSNWIGQPIEIYSTTVSGPNGMTQGIRVRPAAGFSGPPTTEPEQPAPVQPAPTQAPAGTVGPNVTPDFDDDLPF